MSMTNERILAFLNRQRSRESTELPVKNVPAISDNNLSGLICGNKDDTIVSLNNCMKGKTAPLDTDNSLCHDKSRNPMKDDSVSLNLNFQDLKVRFDLIKFDSPPSSSRKSVNAFLPVTAEVDVLNPRRNTAVENECALADNDLTPQSDKPYEVNISGQKGLHEAPPERKQSNPLPRSPLDSFFQQKVLVNSKIRDKIKALARNGLNGTKKTGDPKNRRLSLRGTTTRAFSYSSERISLPVTSELPRRSSVKGEPVRIRSLSATGRNANYRYEAQYTTGPLKERNKPSPSEGKTPKERTDLMRLIKRGTQIGAKKDPFTQFFKENISKKSQTNIKPKQRVRKENLENEFIEVELEESAMDSNTPKTINKTPPASTDRTRKSSSRKDQHKKANTEDEKLLREEIAGLIRIIKEEKQQIFEDMKAMSQKLSKYKAGYKKMKKQVEEYKEKEKLYQEQQQQQTPQLTSDSQGDVYPKATLSKSPLRVITKLQLPIESIVNKRVSQEETESITIESIESATRKSCSSAIIRSSIQDRKLYDHVETLNNHVENIIARSPLKSHGDPTKTVVKPFDFEKFPSALRIIKDMNLDVRVFNRELEKTPREQEVTPTHQTSIAAYREMVNYLYSKLVYEEKQRLATEEQAHLMISTMEKSVLQMEGRLKIYEGNVKKHETTGVSTDDVSRLTVKESVLIN